MDVTIAANEVAAHDIELAPNVVTSVTYLGDVERVEIRYDGTADIYYTRNGTAPTVGGPESYRLPAGLPGLDSRNMGRYSVLKFISSTSATLSVLRDD